MRIELAKLILVGTRITYQATGDAGTECTNLSNRYVKERLKAGNNSRFFMKHKKGKLLTITSKRPSVAGLNCRLLTSFDGQMKYVPGISYSYY